MSDESLPPAPPRREGGGCFSKLFFLLLLLGAAGLGSAISFALRAQDLSDLSSAAPVAQRDMKTVLKNAIDRQYALTLSEAEINQWLARTLSARQGGVLSDQVKLKRVWVRLEDGRAEIIMERTVLGAPFTVSMYLRVERVESAEGKATNISMEGGPYHPDVPRPPKGGRFGRLVVPQGFLLLVLPAYQNLAKLFPEELELGFREMSRITIEKGKLILDPRETQGNLGMPESF